MASLFEPYTDIIRKGGRRAHYGHKLNLTTGRSGLVLDAVVEDGNPVDSERCLPMLGRRAARPSGVSTATATVAPTPCPDPNKSRSLALLAIAIENCALLATVQSALRGRPGD